MKVALVTAILWPFIASAEEAVIFAKDRDAADGYLAANPGSQHQVYVLSYNPIDLETIIAWNSASIQQEFAALRLVPIPADDE